MASSVDLPTFDLPSPAAPRGPIPRQVPAGTVPLLAVEGTAYDCGREYGELVRERYPFHTNYRERRAWWKELAPEVKALYERRAPHLFDLFQGLSDGIGPATVPAPPAAPVSEAGGCTSFGVSGSVTLDGEPFSGQTKDTQTQSAYRYIVLRMRIKDAPTILVLAYPGEVLGYGMWSTGMSIFRNSLYSQAGAEQGLPMDTWGLLMLAGSSVHDGLDLARRFGLAGAGNCLISDPQGESLSVEFNVGGISAVPAREGIATHGNHAEGTETSPFAAYVGQGRRERRGELPLPDARLLAPAPCGVQPADAAARVCCAGRSHLLSPGHLSALGRREAGDGDHRRGRRRADQGATPRRARTALCQLAGNVHRMRP